MKAQVLKSYGDADAFALEEVDTPEPKSGEAATSPAGSLLSATA